MATWRRALTRVSPTGPGHSVGSPRRPAARYAERRCRQRRGIHPRFQMRRREANITPSLMPDADVYNRSRRSAADRAVNRQPESKPGRLARSIVGIAPPEGLRRLPESGRNSCTVFNRKRELSGTTDAFAAGGPAFPRGANCGATWTLTLVLRRRETARPLPAPAAVGSLGALRVSRSRRADP